AVDADGLDPAAALDARLRARRALAGGERPGLPAQAGLRRRLHDAVVAVELALGGREQREALLERDPEGVDLARAAPVALRGGDGAHRPVGGGRHRAGDGEGGAQRLLGAAAGRVAGRGEAPRAGDADADADALDGLRVDALHVAV